MAQGRRPWVGMNSEWERAAMKSKLAGKKEKKKTTAENKSFCCHIWTHEVEQCSPETFCCICLNLTSAYFFFLFFSPLPPR